MQTRPSPPRSTPVILGRCRRRAHAGGGASLLDDPIAVADQISRFVGHTGPGTTSLGSSWGLHEVVLVRQPSAESSLGERHPATWLQRAVLPLPEAPSGRQSHRLVMKESRACRGRGLALLHGMQQPANRLSARLEVLAQRVADDRRSRLLIPLGTLRERAPELRVEADGFDSGRT